MFPETQRVGGKSAQFYVNYSHQVTITFNINQLLVNALFTSKSILAICFTSGIESGLQLYQLYSIFNYISILYILL